MVCLAKKEKNHKSLLLVLYRLDGTWWYGTWWYPTWWYGVQSLEISKLHRRRRLLYHARGLPGCNYCYHQPLFVVIGTTIIIIITINIMIILRSRQETFLRAFDARISPSAAITWTSQLFKNFKKYWYSRYGPCVLTFCWNLSNVQFIWSIGLINIIRFTRSKRQLVNQSLLARSQITKKNVRIRWMAPIKDIKKITKKIWDGWHQ